MNSEKTPDYDRKRAAQVEENSPRFLALHNLIYDATKMTDLASLLAHQSLENARHTSRNRNIPDGYLLINELTADRIEFAIGKAQDFVSAAWEVYEDHRRLSPVIRRRRSRKSTSGRRPNFGLASDRPKRSSRKRRNG
jgi:hypothetical protein